MSFNLTRIYNQYFTIFENIVGKIVKYIKFYYNGVQLIHWIDYNLFAYFNIKNYSVNLILLCYDNILLWYFMYFFTYFNMNCNDYVFVSTNMWKLFVLIYDSEKFSVSIIYDENVLQKLKYDYINVLTMDKVKLTFVTRRLVEINYG